MSILDRFFEARGRTGQSLDKEDLHLYGLTAVFMASKLEDMMPISMNDILYSAAHGKFQQKQVLKAEVEILQALGFKLLTLPTLVDEVSSKFLQILKSNNSESLFQESTIISDCIGFAC